MSDYHESVRVASTANVNTAVAPATIDGVTMVRNNLVLLKDQTTGAQNGIYVWRVVGEPLVRYSAADNAAELNSGALIPVEEGTAGGNKVFMLTTDNPIKIGTTALVFAQV